MKVTIILYYKELTLSGSCGGSDDHWNYLLGKMMTLTELPNIFSSQRVYVILNSEAGICCRMSIGMRKYLIGSEGSLGVSFALLV